MRQDYNQPDIDGSEPDEAIQPPDLDFDKYGAELKKLGIDHVLEHVKYWRYRCLMIEYRASQAIEEWHAFGYNADSMTERMDALADLLDEGTAGGQHEPGH